MTAATLIPLLLLGAGDIEAHFVQVHPEPAAGGSLERTPGRDRAVVLIHGLKLHPFSAGAAGRAGFHRWQQPGSAMVLELGAAADVFAFAYAQTAPVEEIARLELFERSIARLKALGYPEVVLVGHSGGGLIARQFVEDRPEAGVTKVIQACAPNLGSSWASWTCAVRAAQEPFLRSFTREARLRSLRERQGKEIPAAVEFLCLIADGTGTGDWVVSDRSQWPVDLRAQGIPAVRLVATHRGILTRRGARRVAELVSKPCPRWSREAVAAGEAAFLARPSLTALASAVRRTPQPVKEAVVSRWWPRLKQRAMVFTGCFGGLLPSRWSSLALPR
jgi:pimeloyl-ACP methyl ester carboxylesterase